MPYTGQHCSAVLQEFVPFGAGAVHPLSPPLPPGALVGASRKPARWGAGSARRGTDAPTLMMLRDAGRSPAGTGVHAAALGAQLCVPRPALATRLSSRIAATRPALRTDVMQLGCAFLFHMPVARSVDSLHYVLPSTLCRCVHMLSPGHLPRRIRSRV